MRKQHKRAPQSVKLEPLPSTSKGKFNRHIIAEGKDSKREYSLHATKGYRSRTLAGER